MTTQSAAIWQRSPSSGKQQESWWFKLGVITLIAALLFQLWTLTSHRQPSTKSSSISANMNTAPLPSPEDPTIILLGLPRSGSLAVHDYFTCHGKPSTHYCCGGGGSISTSQTAFPCAASQKTCGDCVLKNLQSSRPAFQDCGNNPSPKFENIDPEQQHVWSSFDVETADAWFLPQHFALGLLHQAYPNATWILNTRNSAPRWAESIYHWNSLTRRFLTSYQLDVYPYPIPSPPNGKTKVTAEEIEQDMQAALDQRVYNRTEQLRKLALLERIYRNHTTMVQLWARQFPSHRFVQINVDDDASLSQLDEVFGHFSPGKCEWDFELAEDDWQDFSLPFE